MSPKAERRAARRRMVRDAHARWRSIRFREQMGRLWAKCDEACKRFGMGPAYRYAQTRAIEALRLGIGPSYVPTTSERQWRAYAERHVPERLAWHVAKRLARKDKTS